MNARIVYPPDTTSVVDSPEKRSTVPWLWRIAVIAFVVIAVIVALQFWSRQPSFRRFISQPLPDGSRYTFLYPAHLKVVNENGKGASPNVTHNANVTNRVTDDPIIDRFRRWVGLAAPSPAELVTVVVFPVKGGKVRDSRSSEEFARGIERRRNEYLVDARTGCQFSLYFSCPIRARRALNPKRPK